MTIKTLSKLLIVAVVTLMTSCNENEPTGPDVVKVPQFVMENFKSMYPTAQNVNWEENGNYLVAHFNLQQTRAAENNNSAWFLAENGSWGMTETDILFSELPEAVKDAFNTSEYSQAPWKLDNEVDKLTRTEKNETIYVIEVKKIEGNIETEINLYYAESGILVKTIIDADENEDHKDMVAIELPSAIQDWIVTNYPNAKIIESEFDNNIYEFEFIDGEKEFDAMFDAAGKWFLSKFELEEEELPVNILEAVKTSEFFTQYPEIDDVEKFETASAGVFYEIELENEIKDIEIYIDAQGMVISKPEIPELKAGLSVNETIAQFINSKYPNSVITEKENEDGYLCIEIEQNGIEKELRFNGKNEWIDSEWDMDIEDVPAEIMNVLKTTYPNVVISNEVEYYESPQNIFYEFEIMLNNEEVEIVINSKGEIVK